MASRIKLIRLRTRQALCRIGLRNLSLLKYPMLMESISVRMQGCPSTFKLLYSCKRSPSGFKQYARMRELPTPPLTEENLQSLLAPSGRALVILESLQSSLTTGSGLKRAHRDSSGSLVNPAITFTETPIPGSPSPSTERRSLGPPRIRSPRLSKP